MARAPRPICVTAPRSVASSVAHSHNPAASLCQLRTVIETEVCIIGSGISAAMVAERLARGRTRDILVLEAGDNVPPLAHRYALRERTLAYGEKSGATGPLEGHQGEGAPHARSLCV